MAHDLYAIWRDVRDQTGGEIESGASDCLPQTCGAVSMYEEQKKGDRDMQYRRFGKLDWECSALGFGCARFPKVGDDWRQIDEPKTIEMLHYAIDHGVNYIDTAADYAAGNSERVVGKALQGGHRQKVRLATKLQCWEVKSAGDFDRLLDESLKRLQMDHIDIYELHRLSTYERSWPNLRDLGVFEWAEGAISDGRIGHLGFSFHDAYDVFQEIIDAYDKWAMCMLQYNYMDIENQAGQRGLRYAASKGLPVVIMEPLLGGKLAEPPEPVRAVFESAPQQRTPVDWSLQWLWNQPEVSVVLSGMSTLEQVAQNVASAGASGVDTLTPEELALVERVRDKYLEYRAIPCTQCRYCMPCPNTVDIPFNFAAYNRGVMHDNLGFMRYAYSLLPEEARASACVECGECEPKCSQRIPISEWMPQVHAVLGKEQPYPNTAPQIDGKPHHGPPL